MTDVFETVTTDGLAMVPPTADPASPVADGEADEKDERTLAGEVSGSGAAPCAEPCGPDSDEEGEPDRVDADPLAEFALTESDGIVVTGQGVPVTNFTITLVRVGRADMPDGTEAAYHVAEVALPDGTSLEVGVEGDVYDPAAWMAAGAGRLSVLDRKRFRAYVLCVLTRCGRCETDPWPHVSHMVGTFRAPDGELRISRGLKSVSRARLSLYARRSLPESGSVDLFGGVAALTSDDVATAVLTHALGAVLKPVLGGAYPHLSLTGPPGSGKSTILGQLESRFGFVVVDAPAQLDTAFRQKVALSGSVLPLYADEVGRLSPGAARRLGNSLNSSYRSSWSTHGSSGRAFRLTVPFVGVGQGWAVGDDALRSKVLIYELDPDAKNPDALQALRAMDGTFPLRQYMYWACGYADSKDLAARVDGTAALLRERLPRGLAGPSAAVDRCLWNYASQVCVAHALRRYGLDVDITGFLERSLHDHLRLLTAGPGSEVEQFVEDLLQILAWGRTPPELLYGLRAEGLVVNVRSALEVLRRAGYGYGSSHDHVVTRQLVREGLAESGHRYYINGIRRRMVLFTRKALQAKGFDVSAFHRFGR